MRLTLATSIILTILKVPKASSRTFISINASAAAFLQNHRTKQSRGPSSTCSALHSMVTMDSPSAQRNKDPIWSVLESTILPSLKIDADSAPINVLEIAAGSGVHSTYFVEQMAKNNMAVQWFPTDPDQPSLISLQARVKEYAPSNNAQIATPLKLTLDIEGIMENDTKDFLADQTMNLMMCINMIHISPWSATLGLFELASQRLDSGGILMTYGPYKVNGRTAPSNLQFNVSLKARNPEWGVRDLERVQAVAEEKHFKLSETIEMPANNLCLIFTKA